MAHELKIAVIGANGAGKSALTVRYMEGRFVDVYDPTVQQCVLIFIKIDEPGKKWLTIDNENVHLYVLDTNGQEDMLVLRESYTKTADGFVLCASLTESHALEEAKSYLEFVIQVREANDMYDTPIVIAATKSDLTEKRKVQASDLQQFATKYGIKCIETSAKCDKHVNEAFEMCVRDVCLQRKASQMRKQQAKQKAQVICNVQ